MEIALTGGSGFIGKELICLLESKVLSLTRQDKAKSPYIKYDSLFDIKANDLNRIKVLIHLAGLVHKKNICIHEYKRVNTELTIHLAKEAVEAGIKRFIFISTINVYGSQCEDATLKFNSAVCPESHYAQSNLDAELALKKIAQETGLEVVIIRPPLVYGKNAPGNFGTLLKIAEKNLPLPFGAIDNQRSLVAIDNLVDLINTCVEHPAAANQTFLVSDDENISTSNILKKLTLAAGKKSWLLPVPVSFLKFIASILGKTVAVEKFSSSLIVDIEHTKKTLGWKPPITLDEGFRRCFE